MASWPSWPSIGPCYAQITALLRKCETFKNPGPRPLRMSKRAENNVRKPSLRMFPATTVWRAARSWLRNISPQARIAKGPTQRPQEARPHSPGLSRRPRRAAAASFARSRGEADGRTRPPRGNPFRANARPSRATPGPRGGSPRRAAGGRGRPAVRASLGAACQPCRLPACGLCGLCCHARGHTPAREREARCAACQSGGASRRRGARGRLRRPLEQARSGPDPRTQRGGSGQRRAHAARHAARSARSGAAGSSRTPRGSGANR
jgi:hypothetical protein